MTNRRVGSANGVPFSIQRGTSMLILLRPRMRGIGAVAPSCLTRVFAPASLLGAAPLFRVAREGRSGNQRFQHDHRVCRRARCPAPWGGGMLWSWLWHAFVPTGPVVIGIGETSDRRRGARMAANGIDREPVRSSHRRVVQARGAGRVGCTWRRSVGPTGLSPALPAGTVALGA
jgi:hypothetical protein